MLRWLLIGLCWLPPVQAAQLLVIIDDIGNNHALGQRTLQLPGPLNLAFLPHTPHARSLASEAYQHGHGILLHAPMANEQGAKLGPGGLYPDMDAATLQQTLRDNLAAIPHVQGVNNHMGSLLTQDPDAMAAIMPVIASTGLYFVDSLTSPHSVALQQAILAGIPALERDVFLDNDLSPTALQRQFAKAVARARQRGYAVLIGHPYPETLTFLQQALPALTGQQVHLQRIDQFLQQRLWQKFYPLPSPPSRYLLQASPGYRGASE